MCLLSVPVKIVKDEVTQRSKGYAFIQYTSQENAMLALDSMDHKVIPNEFVLDFKFLL